MSIDRNSGEMRIDFKSGVILISLLLQLLGGVYAYGRLTERVDSMMREVQEIRAIVLQQAGLPAGRGLK